MSTKLVHHSECDAIKRNSLHKHTHACTQTHRKKKSWTLDGYYRSWISSFNMDDTSFRKALHPNELVFGGRYLPWSRPEYTSIGSLIGVINSWCKTSLIQTIFSTVKKKTKNCWKLFKRSSVQSNIGQLESRIWIIKNHLWEGNQSKNWKDQTEVKR